MHALVEKLVEAVANMCAKIQEHDAVIKGHVDVALDALDSGDKDALATALISISTASNTIADETAHMSAAVTTAAAGAVNAGTTGADTLKGPALDKGPASPSSSG